MDSIHKPQPGDAVILTGYFVTKGPGTLGVIGGHSKQPVSITFNAGAFRTDGWVDCSGGPTARPIPVEELVPTGLTIRHRFWRFRDNQVQAGNREDYFLEVPLWAWAGDRSAACWPPAELEVQALLQAKSDELKHLDLFPLPDWAGSAAVYRGSYRLEVEQGDPYDSLGQKLIRARTMRMLIRVGEIKESQKHLVGGNRFEVSIDCERLALFKGEQQLADWMSAYGLQFFSGSVPYEGAGRFILPPVDSASWLPLQRSPI